MQISLMQLLVPVCMSSIVASAPVVFEDSPPINRGLQNSQLSVHERSRFPPPEGSSGRVSLGETQEAEEGRLFHKKKKKKKIKVICGIANLIAGRDAGEQNQYSGGSGREHRVARDLQADQHQQEQARGEQGQGQGRGLPPGTGLAGFILGTLVGSHFGPGTAHTGYPQYPQYPQGTQTQVQVQAQVPAPAPPPVPVPVRPPVVNPAPVHEDYDEVEDDPVSGGAGGLSLCNQLQGQAGSGILGSHFPLINGILSSAGGIGGQQLVQQQQQQQHLYRPQQYYQSYGYGAGQQQRPIGSPGGGLLYQYFKPWTDLFFK